MIEQGVGSRWSMVLVAALALAGLSGCLAGGDIVPDDGSKPGEPAARASVSGSSDEPQQVVQSSRAKPSAAAPAGPANASRLSTAGVARAVAEPRAIEPITSKHLEAELNRLEAELGN